MFPTLVWELLYNPFCLFVVRKRTSAKRIFILSSSAAETTRTLSLFCLPKLCVCVSVSSGPCDRVKLKSVSLSAPREEERTPSQSGLRTPRENVQMTPGTCFLRQRLKRKQTPEWEGRGILPLGLHDVKRGLCSSSLCRTDTLRAEKQERCFSSGEQSFIVILILFRRKKIEEMKQRCSFGLILLIKVKKQREYLWLIQLLKIKLSAEQMFQTNSLK